MIKRIRHWFDDGHFRRLFKNAGILLTGNVGTAGCDLVSLALTARALGPDSFGVLVLIQTYVRVVDSLINFQSWQAIIKYGADMLVQQRPEDFKRLIKFGSLLDVGSALIGAAVSASLVYWVADYQGWGAEESKMAIIYSAVIAFHLVGTPTAVLRLFDKFKSLALQRFGVALLKMLVIAVAFVFDAGIWVFLFVWMAMVLTDYLSLLGLGWYELKRQGYKNIFTSKVKGVSKQLPGLWKFVGTTNLSSSIRLGAKEFDVLIVGAVVGSAAAGLYKVAKQFGSIPTRFADPLQQSIYPDMAKLWAEGSVQKFKRFIVRIGAMSGMGGLMIWLVFLVLGDFILDLTVGKEFAAAYDLLLVYMFGYVIFMFGVAFRPSILSMGFPERILAIYSLTTVIYFVALALLLPQVGVIGASIAQVVFHACWFLCMSLSIARYISITPVGEVGSSADEVSD